MALLHLAAKWAGERGVTLYAATVDHGLRPGAVAEAKLVADSCAKLGVAHQILHWTDWDKRGNLQDAARNARYRLLTQWARKTGVAAVALGHTKDDQAETFLMRLARGSGVDGLASMRHDWQANGVQWLRPILAVTRSALREYLRENGIKWADDPSNEDLRFQRVKARKALEVLAPLGIDIDCLAETSHRMMTARHALSHATFTAAQALCETQNGDILIDKTQANMLPSEVLHRLIAHMLGWVSTVPYRPRFEALVHVLASVSAGKRGTLHGCMLTPEGENIRISREYQSVRSEVCDVNTVWDNRWRMIGQGQGVEIRALGEAVKDCPNWRETGMPRASLMASPALWSGADLVAAPVAGMANGWTAKLEPPSGNFAVSILSH